MYRYILSDSRGIEVAARIDATISKLPGLAWFDKLTLSREENMRRIGAMELAISMMAASD